MGIIYVCVYVWMLCVQEIGGETAEFMGHLIKLRADRMAINITINSLGTPLNEVRERPQTASPWWLVTI